ncbi:hypothetical protein CDD83_9970 [Cordyceps sp. RAO-2017]|nr:hypothetical protein CDD83_9970 [Cordyceps sp. RAO-2017]
MTNHTKHSFWLSYTQGSRDTMTTSYIPLLKGADNMWSENTRVELDVDDLIGFIDGTAYKPGQSASEEAAKDWRRSNPIARRLLYASVSSQALFREDGSMPSMSAAETYHRFWDARCFI